MNINNTYSREASLKKPIFDLSTAEHYNQDFADIIFSNNELVEVEFDNCSFHQCDFSETEFKHCKFIDCHFSNCNLSNIKIGYSRFNEVFFEHCKILGVDWTRAYWPNLSLSSPLKFSNCILNDCSFHSLQLPELQLISCKVMDVDFREGCFNQANFSGSDFSYSLFNHTELIEADFRDAINYSIDIYQNSIKHGKFSRDEALSLLSGLHIELD